MSRRLQPMLALAAALVAMPLSALERGEFSGGLYTAPGQIFTVRVPLGPDPIVIDSFDRAAGAATFVDEAGALYGVICTPSFDVLAGGDNDEETDLAILRNWFHDATFPLFFERQLPGASVVQEGPGTFEGGPAWIGVLHLPQGSAMFRNDSKTGSRTRLDSWRGLVVFSRGEITYLLMTEIKPQADRNDFLPQLAELYQGMEFFGLAPIPVEYELAKVLDADAQKP